MMIISLICIGFSSWNITNQIGGQSLTGSIKADNVINSSEYIDLGVNGVTSFEYCDIGFVDDGKLSSAGRVTAHYLLSSSNCKTLLSNSGENAIKVECTIIGTNANGALNVFSTIPNVRQVVGELGFSKDVFNVRITDEKMTVSQSTATYSFVIRDILDVGGGTISFPIVFKFEVLAGENFKNNFYKYLGNNPTFTVQAKIVGITVTE